MHRLACGAHSCRRSLGGEAPAPATKVPGHGVVARYARHRDYHEVLAERLADLAGFLDRLGGAGSRSLWYTDTGPLLERDLAQVEAQVQAEAGAG